MMRSEIRISKSEIPNKFTRHTPNSRNGTSGRSRFGFRILAFIPFVGILLLAGGCPKPSDAKQRTKSESGLAVPVATAVVVQRATAVTVPSFGTVEACADVEVKAQVTGVLMQVHFTEGQMVKKGDLLLSIDPRQPQATLKMAQANLERDQAQLKNAEREAARQTELLEKGYASQEIYDAAITAVETLRAAVGADQAAIENAALQLDYCSIRSPVDGCTGRLQVHQGNLVKANDVSVISIRQVDPIYVCFWVQEHHLPAIRRHMAAGPLDVAVTVPGEENEPIHGVLSFIDNTVDPDNRTIHLRATFANPDRRLWPGQYVKVLLTITQEPNSILAPSSAVQTSQDSQFVYVVKTVQTVEARAVTARRTVGNETVLEGIQPGETVVTDGQLRLVPGARIQIKGAPSDERQE